MALFISALASPAAADSAIYRCGPAGSQWFSQIPCEENSEKVIVEDPRMFKDTGDSAADTMQSVGVEDSTGEQQADAASRAQAFITQLEKQRNEQLAEIDNNIEELRSRAENPDETEELSGDGEQAAILLAKLQNARRSLMSEYEAMISATRQGIDQP